MYPFLFGVEFLDVYTILVIVGIFAAILLFKKLCAKFEVGDKTYSFYSLNAVISIGAGLVCALLFQQLYNFIDSLRTGEKFVFGGITFFGGLVGGVLTFALITTFAAKPEVKKDFWLIANLAAPCIILGHALGRYGCFCAGCCYGKPTDGFGFVFYGIDYKAIPTNLYEALFLTVFFGVVTFLLFKFRRTDYLLILYGFAYAVFRFIIEFFRGDDRGQLIPGISPSQFISILLFLAAATLTVLVFGYKIVPFAGKAKKHEKMQNPEA